jgi:hypothetical protein
MNKVNLSAILVAVAAIAVAVGTVVNFEPKLYPDQPIPDNSSVVPTYGIIYMVDLDVKNNKIEYYYSGGMSKSLSNGDIGAKRTEFEGWLRQVVDGDNQYPMGWKNQRLNKKCRQVNQTANCHRKDNNLSMPNNQNAFIAFVLNPQKNWSYIVEDRATTTLDPEVLTRFEGSSHNYHDLRKMTRRGHVFTNNVTKPDVVAAYLTANGVAASASRQPDYFNLYTIVTDDDGESIPIVIDPDVRWPGGNE